MRAFPVPVQITNEERIVGGMFTLRQLMFVVIGLTLGGTALALVFLPVIIRIFLFMTLSCSVTVLGFAKKNDLRMDLYLYLYFKWLRSPRSAYLQGEN